MFTTTTSPPHHSTPPAAPEATARRGGASHAPGEQLEVASLPARPTLRRLSRTAALLVLLALSILLAIRFGAVQIGLREILDALLGRGDPTTITIVRELRLPRVLLAALVGSALALSGATFQALVRNPLADPYILGVSSGAAVGAVAALVLGVATTIWAVPAAALAGALCAIVLVFRIAYGVGPTLDTRVLLLAGVVVGAFFNAAILLLLTFADLESFRSAMFWMMGSLQAASWRAVATLGIALIPASLALLALARALNLLSVGEHTATYLGTRVERTKLVAYGVASLLTAIGVATSGAIGFVGLIVPHVARLLWGSDHRWLLPSAALLGATFLVLADLAARLVARPAELPLGVVTAFVGVPFFIWLLRRRGGATR